MQMRLQHAHRFIFSQYFSDGLRIALLILLPSVLMGYFGHLDIGLTISLGAVAVSITDMPGPPSHRRNGMLFTTLFVFAITLLTGFIRFNVFAMAGLLTVLTFVFTMFTVYGTRAGLVGTATLFMMVVHMDKALGPMQVLYNAGYILVGSLWYSGTSLLIQRLFPFHSARIALGEGIRETAEYLLLRADLYNPQIPIDDAYKALVAQQVIVNDKQNELRELLYKNPLITKGTSPQAQAILLTFSDLVDLYEQITTTVFDHAAVREQYAEGNVLPRIVSAITQLAKQMDRMGAAIQANTSFKSAANLQAAIMDVYAKMANATDGDMQVPSTIFHNLVLIRDRLANFHQYFNNDIKVGDIRKQPDYERFISHIVLDKELFVSNLSMSSSTFKHALRMSVACLVGFVVVKLMGSGHHSYWILMTILFMLKPGFSLTRQRNFQRLIGTVLGGTIGVLILLYVHNTVVLFAILFVAMLGTYSFQRYKYIIAVIFLTPYILIMFSFLHMGLMEVARERLMDTAIGCAIALAAGYLILPEWEAGLLKNYMVKVLQANYLYLRTILDTAEGHPLPLTDYKVIRKEVFVSNANLSAALQRMLSEPTSKQKHGAEVHRFVVLSYKLSSVIAAVSQAMKTSAAKPNIQLLRDTLVIINDSLRQLQGTGFELSPAPFAPTPIPEADATISQQLQSARGMCTEIAEIVNLMHGSGVGA